jgi:hypothetical protein
VTVRLITGPPGAGKNTYVEKHKKDGDILVDFDHIRGMYPNSPLEVLESIRTNIEESVKNLPNDVWVIRCVADPKERTEHAERLNAAEVIVVETPADVAKEQVRKRNREGENFDEIDAAIDRWWSQYGVVQSDLIVGPARANPHSDRKKNMSDIQNETSGNESDKGFPAETKIVDMTPEQQAAYWKFQSRKHEGNATSLKAEVDSLKTPKPTAPVVKDETNTNTPIDRDALRKELLADLKREQAPELVRSQFEAIIGERLPEATRNAILEDLNLDRFVNEDGSIDKARIKEKAELLAGKDVKNVRQVRTHQGPRKTETTASVSTGRALFEEFSKKR